jgi:hypothetical protein
MGITTMRIANSWISDLNSLVNRRKIPVMYTELSIKYTNYQRFITLEL